MLTALPNGRGVLFGLCPGRCLDKVDLWVLDLRSRQAKLLVPGAVKAWYAAGRLVFIRPGGTVFGQGFDLGSLALKGAVIPLFDGVRVNGGLVPQAALGGDGSLLYLRGPAERAEHEAVWVGRDGRATPVDTSWGFLQALGGVGWTLSPDGKRLAIGLRANGRDQIWVKELDRGPASRITFDSSGDMRPRWMPDGHTVTYLSRRGGAGLALYRRNADGTGAEALKLKVSGSIWEAVWSRDGKWLVFGTGTAGGNRDVYAMRLGMDSVPRPLLATPAQERAVALSPDGRWLAYMSDESGRDEVYVRPFPNVDDGKWQVSLTGGGQPLWARSGREIFYRSAANQMMVAQVSASPRFSVANRHVLFSISLEMEVDGNFTTIDTTLASAHQSLGMVAHWFDWDWTTAEREFTRAIQLSPNDRRPHQFYAWMLASVGRYDQAIAEAKRAQQLDPVSAEANNYVGLVLVLAHRYEEAITWLRMAIDLDPTYFYAYDFLGRAYEQLGRMPEAITAYQKAVEIDTTNAENWSNLGHAYAVSGRTAEARRILADLRTSSTRGYIAPYDIALIHAGLGDKDQAFAWFERAVDDRSSLPVLYRNDARWDKLHADPRWASLIKRIGLPNP